MKKLNVAIIGQGRSGKDIHGAYFVSDRNDRYTVKYVVDKDPYRRDKAEKMYPGCKAFESYTELFGLKDIDLVVNASYSQMHYPITKDLLAHGFNVLVEKPFARNQYECADLIKTAKDNNVVLAVFQQTFFAPYYDDVLNIMASGKLGKIEQIDVRFNGFARRWDWQTAQRNVAGGLYNTGPHPVGLAVGFLGWDKDTKVAFSKLSSTRLTKGDSDDYAKVILTAPGKPVVDIEVSSIDAYSTYNVKVQGDRGTFKCTPTKYEYKYIIEEENPERKFIAESLENENREPAYCGEKLIFHEESGTYAGTAFDLGTKGMYEDVYYAITEGRPLKYSPEMITLIYSVIETAHAQNPLPVEI